MDQYCRVVITMAELTYADILRDGLSLASSGTFSIRIDAPTDVSIDCAITPICET